MMRKINPNATTTSTTFQITRPITILKNGWKSNSNAANKTPIPSFFRLEVVVLQICK